MKGEQEIVLAAIAADRTAVAALVALLEPVIRARAARVLFRRKSRSKSVLRQEVDDYVQEVFLGLFANQGRALRAWDPDRGMSLRNFVGLLTEHHVHSLCRSGGAYAWPEEDLFALPEEEHGADFPDLMDSIERRVGSRELLNELLHRLRSQLSPKGLELFHRLLVLEEPLESIRMSTGMSADALYAWRSRLARLARTLANSIDSECALVGLSTSSHEKVAL